jgi:hypothetical protein
MSSATDYLGDKIERSIDYCRDEFDITYGEIIGVLEIYKLQMAKEAFEKDEEVE